MNAGVARIPPIGILVAATAYFFLNATTQGLVSPTADLDQAQQLVLSQDGEWGYGAQPPLYTWIVHALFNLTGPRLWVLLGLKAFLLSLLMAGAYEIARLLGLEGARQRAALLGFAFIPQIAWEAQRDLTHSLLATVLSMWTLWIFLLIRRAPEIRNYALLGALIALGVLSKYNYSLFVLSLLVAGLLSDAYRPRLLHARLLFSLALAACLLLPHLAWILAHQDLAASSSHKLGMDGGFVLSGLGDLGMAVLAFSAPLLLVATLSRRRPASQAIASVEQRFLWILAGVVILVLTVAVAASGSTNVKDRWLQPLLFFLPLLVASLAAIQARILNAVALALLVVIAILLPGRTLWAEWSGKVSRPNLPYAVISEEIRKQAGDPELVVADKELLAGNLRLSFPRSRVEVTRTPAEFHAVMARYPGQKVLFVSEGDARSDWHRALARQYGGEETPLRVTESPLLYAPDRMLRVQWLMVSNRSIRNSS